MNYVNSQSQEVVTLPELRALFPNTSFHPDNPPAPYSKQEGVEPTPEELLLIKRKLMRASPWDIRRALNALGWRDQVEALVAAASQDVQDGWEYATFIRRVDPVIEAMRPELGKTPEELDSVFEWINNNPVQ